MDNPLKTLAVTTWYKALAVVAAPAFLLALANTRGVLMLVFGGLFLFAIGEWRYFTSQAVEFRQTPAGLVKVTDRPRNINVVGIVLQIAGVVAVGYGIYRGWALGSFLS